jgi:hypothetical protein
MSTVEMKVPISGNKNEIDGWLENVSQHIDAGNSVEFIDMLDSTDVNISRIQLDTAGSVAIWGKGQVISDAKRIALTAGEFHTIGGIHGIDVANTDASKGLHVKI